MSELSRLLLHRARQRLRTLYEQLSHGQALPLGADDDEPEADDG